MIGIIPQSALTLKPLTVEVNNIDYLVKYEAVKGWDIKKGRKNELST